MTKETLEEYIENYNKLPNGVFKTYVGGYIDGVKWQQERSYSDMQEYATFCIECDRKEMPLLLVQDWYEQFKNK